MWPWLRSPASAEGRRFVMLMFDRDAELLIARHAGPSFAAGADLDVPAAHRIATGLAATLVVDPLGPPSVAVPGGVRDGRPLGVQVIGPRFGGELGLCAAEAIDAATNRITRSIRLRPEGDRPYSGSVNSPRRLISRRFSL